jgi:hypothetical protein
MPDDVAYPAKTSLPVWDTTPPRLDPAAIEYTIYSLASRDDATAHQWARELIGQGVTHQVVRVDGASLPAWLTSCFAEFERLSAAKHVGWRVAAAGDEVGVLAALAAGRHVGLIDTEISTFAETQLRRLVYCAHCKSNTLTRIGERVICSGCQGTLAVRPHCSRDTGSYLGVREPSGAVAGEAHAGSPA